MGILSIGRFHKHYIRYKYITLGAVQEFPILKVSPLISVMLENLKISIIVPIYNVEKYLHQCVDSLIAQKFDSFEIILVDDGSPDSCPMICDEYASKYDKIRVIHKSNGGLSDARNAGLRVAQGTYVTFVDSDDFWKGSDVLSGIYKVINDNNYPDVVVSDFIKYYDVSDKYIMPPFISNKEMNGAPKIQILKYLYFCQADMKMSACQKFAKRELLTSIPFSKGLISEDIDWTLQLYPKVNTICIYDKPYYCYRQQREGSITNTASQRSFDSLIYIIQKWSESIPKLSIPQSEKDIYLGYLAYQLSVSMTIYSSLDKIGKSRAINAIKDNKYLFSFPLNSKTKKVKSIVRFFGFANACRLLGLFQKTKAKLNL